MAKPKKMNRGITGNVKNYPDSSPKMVQLSKGHAFENFLQLKAFCGVELSGWRYGNPQDIECDTCRELYDAYIAEKEAASKKR